MEGDVIMKTIYSTEYLNSGTGSVMERAKSKFQSKYPDKYQHLEYDTPISEIDVISIEKIFGVTIPKYIDDMKKQGMGDKYTMVRNRYLVNSIRDKINEEKKEFEASKRSAIRDKLQTIGKSAFNVHKTPHNQIS